MTVVRPLEGVGHVDPSRYHPKLLAYIVEETEALRYWLYRGEVAGRMADGPDCAHRRRDWSEEINRCIEEGRDLDHHVSIPAERYANAQREVGDWLTDHSKLGEHLGVRGPLDDEGLMHTLSFFFRNPEVAVELSPKVGDGDVREAAYRGG
ncbi:hypothetical protein [Roseomonas chloroacetimidivorans]|uniref:hypothetical protein n=1 Tax=Roseomonas chloroacetimidivorans TaxID=1766656 RepID=UPI003C7730DE